MRKNHGIQVSNSTITFYLFTLLLVNSTTICAQTAVKLTPAQMQSDVDSLLFYINETHPNPYYRYSEEQLLSDARLLKAGFDKDLDQVEFYLKIQPLLGNLQDGHTDIGIPLQMYNAENPYILPYIFSLSSNEPYIIYNHSYPSFENKLPKEAEIVSINNTSSHKIVLDIIKLNTGESLDFRAGYGADFFETFYLESLYNANGKYNVKFKVNNSIEEVLLEGIKKDELDKRLKHYSDTAKKEVHVQSGNYSLKLLDNEKTAIIGFWTFDWTGYKLFVDSAFTLIKNKGINNLIIDLRDNGGGYSDVGDDFFQYILDKPFKQYEKEIGKNSLLLKKRLLERVKDEPLSGADSILLATPNGLCDTIYYEDIEPENNPIRFNGNIYLLVNIRTFSSAADFAQCFKYHRRGLVIGEETGGLIESYGDIVTTRLPNSKLELTISSKLYYNVGAKEGDWIGVVPDEIAPSNKAMEKALQIIKEQQQ